MVGELRGHLVLAPFAGHQRHEKLGRVAFGLESHVYPVVHLHSRRHRFNSSPLNPLK
jgi:hypothetical protein